MRLLAATQGFGFGPTSMLNRALGLLPENTKVDVHTPPDMMGIFDARSHVRVTTAPLNVVAVKGLYDAAIVACDYELAAVLRPVVAKVVVFDMLFWFWPMLHPVVDEDILVLAQDFFGVRERAVGRASVQVVGPLLPPTVSEPVETRANHVVVNLGGFTSPYHGRDAAVAYSNLLLPSIRTLLHVPSQLTIMGGSGALDALAAALPESRPYICQLHHDAARSRIARASHYLTVPGLGSIYESFLAGTPTFFLPPSNYSQALQLQSVVDRIGYPWAVCFPAAERGIDEAAYISSLFSSYRAHRQAVARELHEAVRDFIASDIRRRCAAVATGCDFIDGFGGSGEAAARQALKRYLDG